MDLLEFPADVKNELESDLKITNSIDPIVIETTKCGDVYISNNGEFNLKCSICDKQFHQVYKFCRHILKDHKNIEICQSIDDFCCTSLEIDVAPSQSSDNYDIDTKEFKTRIEEDEIPILIQPCDPKECNANINLSSYSTEHDEDPLKQTRPQTRSTASREHKIKRSEKLKSLFECPYCVQKFQKKLNLRKHVDHKHATEKTNKNDDNCEISSENNSKSMEWSRSISNASKDHNQTKKENEVNPNTKFKSKNIKINCKLCGKETPKNKLSQHLRSHDFSRYTYKCNECGKLFISEKSLDIHVKNLHLKEKPFACNIDNCNRSFVTEHALTAHQKLHSTEREYQCPHCLKEFLHKSKLTYHIKVYHDTGKILDCDQCYKQFFDMYTLEKHKVCYHIDNINEVSPKSDSDDIKTVETKENVTELIKDKFENLKCPETNIEQSFHSTNDESIFDERKRRPGTYECIYCELKFIYKSNLREHINRKHSDKIIKNEENLDSSESDNAIENVNKKKQRRNSQNKLSNNKKSSVSQTQRSQEKLICDICGKETVKYKMIQHLRSHDNTRYTHKCNECGKLFISDKSLQIHMKNYHLKDRPFACTFGHCNKTFATENALTAHHILHTSQRPFKCSICQKGFVRKSKMEYHIKTYHVNGRIFKCDECGKRFYEIHTLQVHKICHSNEKPFACDECPARFPRERSLAWHKQSHSGVKPYVCKVCGKEYALYNGIYSHMKTHGIKYSLAFERGEVNMQDIDSALATGTTNATATT